MKNYKIFVALVIAILGFGACGTNSKDKLSADSAAVLSDKPARDTPVVTPADSTHSVTNDRGTDSISVGTNVPLKP